MHSLTAPCMIITSHLPLLFIFVMSLISSVKKHSHFIHPPFHLMHEINHNNHRNRRKGRCDGGIPCRWCLAHNLKCSTTADQSGGTKKKKRDDCTRTTVLLNTRELVSRDEDEIEDEDDEEGELIVYLGITVRNRNIIIYRLVFESVFNRYSKWGYSGRTPTKPKIIL